VNKRQQVDNIRIASTVLIIMGFVSSNDWCVFFGFGVFVGSIMTELALN
jgi:hypothetical protein